MKNLMIASAVFMASLLSNVVLAEEGGQSVAPSAQPNLVIYRAEDRSAMAYRIMVDGKRVGKLTKHAVIGLQLEEGEHVISASDKKRTELKVTVVAGGVTYISGHVDKRHRISLESAEPTQDAVAAMAPSMTMANIN